MRRAKSFVELISLHPPFAGHRSRRAARCLSSPSTPPTGNVMGYLNIVRHPGWEQPASGVRDPGRMSLSLVGLLDTIAPDFTQELRVSDDEIWLWPAAERAPAMEVAR